MMDINRKVVGIGEILWDVFPDRKVLGGAPANFAYHVSQFGLEGYAVSAVGDDDPGRGILAHLDQKGLDYIVDIVGYPTGSVTVELSGDGIPEYTITEGVAWDHIPWTEALADLAARCRAACFGTLAQRSPVSRATIRQFLSCMPPDSMRILDINLRGDFYDKEVIEGSLEIATVLKINDEEIIVAGDMLGIEGGAEERARGFLDRYGLDTVILTKGTAGSYVATTTGESTLATPRVDVADTVGAGDSFTAAFTVARLNGWDVAQAHRLAVEVSAYVCRHHGATPRLADSFRELFR